MSYRCENCKISFIVDMKKCPVCGNIAGDENKPKIEEQEKDRFGEVIDSNQIEEEEE